MIRKEKRRGGKGGLPQNQKRKKPLPIITGDSKDRVYVGKDQTGGQGSAIRIPQSQTVGGAGFGDPITDNDREFASAREPVGRRITYGVAYDVVDKWFSVDDPRTSGADPELNLKIQNVLKSLNAKVVFGNALALERVHGWSLIAVSFSDAKNDGDHIKELPKSGVDVEVKQLEAFSKRQVRTVKKETNLNSPRFGEPLVYELNRGGGKKTQIHWTRVIKLQTRVDASSVLDVVWDDITCYRNIRWGMGQTMFRYGSGFPVITVKGKTLEQLRDYEAQGYFANLTSRTYLLTNDTVQFTFEGVAGRALDPTPYYNGCLENISAGSGIPLAMLRGAQAGALTGSEVNEREYFKVISSIQSSLEPCVRWLIDKAKSQAEVDAPDYEVRWVGGFQPSEKDKAETELLQEQAQEIRLKYMTVDEVRKLSENNLGELPNKQEGRTVLGLQRTQMPKEEQPATPGGA